MTYVSLFASRPPTDQRERSPHGVRQVTYRLDNTYMSSYKDRQIIPECRTGHPRGQTGRPRRQIYPPRDQTGRLRRQKDNPRGQTGHP